MIAKIYKKTTYIPLLYLFNNCCNLFFNYYTLYQNFIYSILTDSLISILYMYLDSYGDYMISYVDINK